MGRFPRIFQVISVSSVPVVGVAAADWTEATALALYWCENVMVTTLVGCGLVLRPGPCKTELSRAPVGPEPASR